MKLIKQSNKNVIIINQSDWVKIGTQNGWLVEAREKGNENVIIINSPDEMESIINSFGAKRFYVEFEKKDGTLRKMHAQRKVDKYKMNERVDLNAGEMMRDKGLILLYDLDVASKKGRSFGPAIAPEQIKTKEKSLQKSYRRIYPNTVEYIKIGSNEYLNGFKIHLSPENQSLRNSILESQ